MKLSPIFALAANASILQFDYDQYEVQTVQARQRAKRTTDEETVANSYRKVFYFLLLYFLLNFEPTGNFGNFFFDPSELKMLLTARTHIK